MSVLGALVVSALAIALWWPHTAIYWFDSHEQLDYVSRTVEYRDALAHGELYPRWSPNFYGGYGSPFFNFYAPVVYWLGGALALATDSPTVALKLIVLIGSLLAGLGAFALVHLETKRADAAFLAAGLYLAAPYRLANVSWRGDLAEFFALGVLPVALWSYRRIARADHAHQLPERALVAVIAHAVLVCSHTLTGLWGTGFIAVIAVLSIHQLAKRRSLERGFALVAAFLCALLASAIYTLPALGEKRFVRVETMTANEVATLNNLIAPARLWAEGPMRIAPLLGAAFAAVLVATAVARLRKRHAPIGAVLWLLGAGALVLLTLPVAEPIWAARLIPFGDYLQFPWRLLGPASLGAATALALAFAACVPERSWLGVLALPLVAGALFQAQPYTSLTPMEGERVLLSTQRIKTTWVRGTSFDEYLPREVTNASKRIAHRITKSNEMMSVTKIVSDGTDHALAIEAKSKGTLELKLHAFPGWRVRTLEGPSSVALATSKDGLVQLHVPKPGKYRVHVAFGSTRLRDLAGALSLLGLAGAWPLVWLLTRRSVAKRRVAIASPIGEEHALA